MKIANIIHGDDLVNHKKIDYVEYYHGSVHDILIKNPELPTLYVGWDYIKDFMHDNEKLRNINILKHSIINNELYWEFSFKENKSSHVSGVASFVKNAPDFYFTPRFKYINLDPVYDNIGNNQDLFDVLPSNITKTYWLKDRMLYILSSNTIYGLDLDMYRFFKFDVDDLKQKLFEISFNFVHDPDGTYYQKYCKIFPEFSLLKRYLVVLVSI